MSADRRGSSRTRFVGGVLPPAARIHPGREVIVVDLSRTGALVEGVWRFRPGARVDVQLGNGVQAASVRGRVERCYVASLGPGDVRYRAAVRFDAPVAVRPAADLLAGYALPEGSADDRARSGQTLPRTR